MRIQKILLKEFGRESEQKASSNDKAFSGDKNANPHTGKYQ